MPIYKLLKFLEKEKLTLVQYILDLTCVFSSLELEMETFKAFFPGTFKQLVQKYTVYCT